MTKEAVSRPLQNKAANGLDAIVPAQRLPFPIFLTIALALIFIWGTAYTLVGVGVRYVAPIWLVAGRCTLGAALVLGYARFRGHRLPPLTDRRWLWYSGLGFTGMVMPFWLLSMGQLSVDSGVTAIIVGAMPILTIVLAHFFAGEPMSWRKFIGFLIGFTGIIVLFLPRDLSFNLASDWKGQLYIVLAALFYASTTVAAKRAPQTPASLGAAIMLISAALIATIWALLSGVPKALPSPIGLWVILALGVGSTALGNILYLYIIQKEGPSMLARINYFPPIVSVIAGIALLHEPFEWRAIFALGVVLIGVWLTRSKVSKPAAPPSLPD